MQVLSRFFGWLQLLVREGVFVGRVANRVKLDTAVFGISMRGQLSVLLNGYDTRARLNRYIRLNNLSDDVAKMCRPRGIVAVRSSVRAEQPALSKASGAAPMWYCAAAKFPCTIRRLVPASASREPGQCDVCSSGSRSMNQLSQSVREPPARAAVNARLSDGISQRRLARPPSIATVWGFRRFSGEA